MRRFIPQLQLVGNVEELEQTLGLPAGAIHRLGTASILVEHRIPKRNPALGHRIVWAIDDEEWQREIRTINRMLVAFLEDRAGYPGRYAHGYIRGRSIATNARCHVGAPGVLRADIRNFFGSISVERATKRLQDAGTSSFAASALASMSSVDGRLALGIATSPTLANLVTMPLDVACGKLAGERGLQYSRYADDLTFSGAPDELPSRQTLKELLEKDGFELNESKFSTKKRGQAFVVTGLSVADTRPRVPRRNKRQVRQEVYYVSRFGLASHAERHNEVETRTVNRVRGWIDYIHGIEPALGAELRTTWLQALGTDSGPVWPPTGRLRGSVHLYIDESVVTRNNGSRMLALVMLRTRSPASLGAMASTFARRLARDSYRVGVRGQRHLEQGTLHYADLAEDERAHVASFLGTLPFQAYIAYARLREEDGSAYAEQWLRLLRRLLRDRMPSLDGCTVQIEAEENPQVRGAEISHVANREFARAAASNSRRPLSVPSVNTRSKREAPGLGIADSALGLFTHYARLKTKDFEASHAACARFERIRSRVRVVLDLDTGDRYDHDNEFIPWSASADKQVSK